MFDALKVHEEKLDQALQYDLSLIEKAESIRTDVEKIVRMDVGGGEWRQAMDSLKSKVEELDRMIDERSEILRGLNG